MNWYKAALLALDAKCVKFNDVHRLMRNATVDVRTAPTDQFLKDFAPVAIEPDHCERLSAIAIFSYCVAFREKCGFCC